MYTLFAVSQKIMSYFNSICFLFEFYNAVITSLVIICLTKMEKFRNQCFYRKVILGLKTEEINMMA